MLLLLILMFWIHSCESHVNNCSEMRKIVVSPGERFTLTIDEDGVEENSLVDDSGTDIARINMSGVLTVLDEQYKDKISAKGFSFQVQNTTTKGQKKFTASVLYRNGTHCSQTYLAIVRGDQYCGENKEIIYTFPDSNFTLYFNSTKVERISWVGSNGLNIGITKDKAILEILENEYEGKLSVIGVSLCIHSPNTKDHGQYTARVIFKNETGCLQHYFVRISDYQWYHLLSSCQNSPIAITYLIFGLLIGLVCQIVRRWWLKIKEKKNKKEQNKSEHLQSERRKGGVVCRKSCTQEDVSGAEGGEVDLRINHTEIRVIFWGFLPEGTNIVTTKPGRSIDDGDVIPQYRGRVRSDDDGSLQIYKLSPRDQRIYEADIRTNNLKTFCVLFNLTVYDRLLDGDIKISHSLTRNGSCSLRLLCTVEKRDVTITWSHGRGGHINVTQGALYVPASDVNSDHICTASNPVSNVSKSVIPGSYCMALDTEPSESLGVKRNPLCLILSGIVLLITCCIFIYHIKSEVMPSSQANRRRIYHEAVL